MWTWKETVSPYDICHYGVLGMHWGVRRYQPYPSGERVKGGKEIGEAAKKSKLSGKDKKDYKRQQKRTGASYQVLKKDTKLIDRGEKEVKQAKKQYEKAVKKKVLNPFNKTKKAERRRNIMMAEENLMSASNTLEKLQQDRITHKAEYDREIKKLGNLTNDLASKYGNIKIGDMKAADKKLGKDWTVTILSNQKHAGAIARYQYNKYADRERKKG